MTLSGGAPVFRLTPQWNHQGLGNLTPETMQPILEAIRHAEDTLASAGWPGPCGEGNPIVAGGNEMIPTVIRATDDD